MNIATKGQFKDRQVLIVSRIIFKILLPFLGGLRVSGEENVPRAGPVLFCPNHTSDLDPVVVLAATLRNDLNALAKSELFDINVLGAYFRAIGAYPVKRDSPDRGALRVAEGILTAGRMLLIFPEGRCSPTGKLQKLQSGAALLAIKTGAPIVPIGIRGSRSILPYGRCMPGFAGGGVSLIFGTPLEPSAYERMAQRAALTAITDDLRARLALLTGQP